jgi:hypothetical protein
MYWCRGSTIARTKQVGGLTVEIDVCESCQKRVYITEKVGVRVRTLCRRLSPLLTKFVRRWSDFGGGQVVPQELLPVFPLQQPTQARQLCLSVGCAP